MMPVLVPALKMPVDNGPFPRRMPLADGLDRAGKVAAFSQAQGDAARAESRHRQRGRGKGAQECPGKRGV